jgi:xanthine permease XanP
MQNSNNKVDPALEIVCKLNDKPPPGETMFEALRHLLAIIVGIMTPPPVLKLLHPVSSTIEVS